MKGLGIGRFRGRKGKHIDIIGKRKRWFDRNFATIERQNRRLRFGEKNRENRSNRSSQVCVYRVDWRKHRSHAQGSSLNLLWFCQFPFPSKKKKTKKKNEKMNREKRK